MKEPYETLLAIQSQAEVAKRAANNVNGYVERAAFVGELPPVNESLQISVSVVWLSRLLDFAFSEGESGA